MPICTNTSQRPIFIKGRLVLPGQSIEVDAAINLPSGAAPPTDDFDPAALLTKSARDIDDALAALDKDRLEALHRLESQADKPRASVLDSLNAALLQRAG